MQGKQYLYMNKIFVSLENKFSLFSYFIYGYRWMVMDIWLDMVL